MHVHTVCPWRQQVSKRVTPFHVNTHLLACPPNPPNWPCPFTVPYPRLWADTYRGRLWTADLPQTLYRTRTRWLHIEKAQSRQLESTPSVHAPLLSSTPATAALPPPVTFTSSAEPRGSQATSHLNSNFPSEPLDARPNPRFASHLTPIYTEALAREYELEQTNARLDAERIASAKQAAQKITIYAWKPDADAPEIRSIQQGSPPQSSLSSTLSTQAS
jgi:hypothetical protein